MTYRITDRQKAHEIIDGIFDVAEETTNKPADADTAAKQESAPAILEQPSAEDGTQK